MVDVVVLINCSVNVGWCWNVILCRVWNILIVFIFFNCLIWIVGYGLDVNLCIRKE